MGLDREIDRIYRESLEADYEAISRTAQPTGHYTVPSAMGSVGFEAVQAVPVNHLCLGTRPQLYTITSCTLRMVTPDAVDNIAERRRRAIEKHLEEENHHDNPSLETSTTTDAVAAEDTFTGVAEECSRKWKTPQPSTGRHESTSKKKSSKNEDHHGGRDREQMYQPAYEALRDEGPTFRMEPKATELPPQLPSHGEASQSFATYPVVTFENVDYIHPSYMTPERFKSLEAGGLLKVPEDGFVDRWPEMLIIERSVGGSKKTRATAYLRADLLVKGWKNRPSTIALREALELLLK